MVAYSNVVACAVAGLVAWTALGWHVARRLLPGGLALPFAPLCGWALHSVFALSVFWLAPSYLFSPGGLAAVTAVAVAIGWLVLRADRAMHRTVTVAESPDDSARIAPGAWIAALALAIACAVAILPKHVGDAVYLSEQIFDHAKVAMVDDMVRLGLPAGNPFFADDGGSGRLSYYYLLHFSAAELARSIGASGWEADIAMTFFAAFTSLAAMMALAVRFSGRAAASGWVVALAATSSARVVLVALSGDRVDDWIAAPGGFGGWLFQVSWVPQHLISTTCVLLAVLLLSGAARRGGVAAVVAAALVIAAGFESSTWVGGLVFALVAAAIVPLSLMRAAPGRRVAAVLSFTAVGAIALLAVLPFLHDQLAASALRGSGFPVAIRLSPALGRLVPAGWRTLLDGPAWWLAFLPVALPAMYVPGLVGIARTVRGRDGPRRADVAAPLAWTTLVALCAAWLLVSTIADNNDLGWRAGLLASVGLIAFAGATLATWGAARRRLALALATVALLLGVPEAALQLQRNATGRIEVDGVAFAEAPDLWRAVREHSRPDERIASNPQSFEHMTPWPDNIGWALLADRRSCYAGWELAQVFTAVPHDRLRAIDARFRRLFAAGGSDDATAADVASLASDFHCDLALVTRQDGAWPHDPFAGSADYALIDERADRWRLYRRRASPPSH